MADLIRALKIFLLYGNPANPIHCEHDTLFVMVDPEKVTHADKSLLANLDFHPNDDECFVSYRFGSA